MAIFLIFLRSCWGFGWGTHVRLWSVLLPQHELCLWTSNRSATWYWLGYEWRSSQLLDKGIQVFLSCISVLYPQVKFREDSVSQESVIQSVGGGQVGSGYIICIMHHGIGHIVPTRHGTWDTHPSPTKHWTWDKPFSLDIGPGISPLHYTWDLGYPPVSYPQIGPRIPPSPVDMGPGILTPVTDIWWSSLETCSNLLTWGHTHLQYWYLVAATEICMVG